MANILSQDEVDSLLQGIGGEEPQSGQLPQSRPVQPADARPYDFSSGDTSIRGQLPGLDAVFNSFSRRLRNLFTMELAKSVGVDLTHIDFVSYDDFTKGLPLPSSMHVVRLEPLRGAAVFVIEAHLAYSLVDLFFGGDGQKRSKVEGRGFTPIETSFVGKFVTKMLTGVEEAWEPVAQLKGHYLRSEINPYLLGAAATGDVMISASYRINLGQVSGHIIFAVPLSALAGVRERLKIGFTAPDPDNEPESVDDATRAALRTHMRGVEVMLQAVVDVLELRIEEIVNLRPGDLIQLNRRGMEQVQLWVEGKAILRGRGAQSDGIKVFVVSEPYEQK
jgi:flagellar motor switch protein FliM